MDKYKKILSEKCEFLDKYGMKIPPVEDAARKLGVEPGVIMAVALTFTALILLLVKGFAIVVLSYAVLYPGIMSIRAIETESKEDDK